MERNAMTKPLRCPIRLLAVKRKQTAAAKLPSYAPFVLHH
jgi:hypothetical protein